MLDEPFSGIDPIAVLDLQKIISDLKASGIGVLITDHNVRETLAVTDRAYIIDGGRIFSLGHARAVRQRSPGAESLPGRELFAGLRRQSSVVQSSAKPPILLITDNGKLTIVFLKNENWQLFCTDD